MSIRKEAAQTIKMVMLSEGISATSVAEGLGLSRSHLSQILSGSGSTEKLDQIMEFIGYNFVICSIKKV